MRIQAERRIEKGKTVMIVASPGESLRWWLDWVRANPRWAYRVEPKSAGHVIHLVVWRARW